MIDTVSKLALYDIDGFIDRERFDVLVEPLTSQLDSPLLTGLSSSDYLVFQNLVAFFLKTW